MCNYRGLLDNFTLHHVNPGTHRFNLNGNWLTRRLDTLALEASKCALLCIRCRNEAVAGKHQNLKPIQIDWTRIQPDLKSDHTPMTVRKIVEPICKTIGASTWRDLLLETKEAIGKREKICIDVASRSSRSYDDLKGDRWFFKQVASRLADRPEYAHLEGDVSSLPARKIDVLMS